METVLRQLNSVPTVIGSMVCTVDGRVVAEVFPPLFDGEKLHEVSSVLADSFVGLQRGEDDVDLMDFRYLHGRILVKPLKEGFLLLLCEKTANQQLLKISMNVALKKIESKFHSPQAAPKAASPGDAIRQPAAESPKPTTPAPTVRKEDGKVILTVDTMKASANVDWDQMQENAAISRQLAMNLGEAYRAKGFKKIKLTNRSTGSSKPIQVRVIDRGGGEALDDKVVLTLAAAEVLKVKPGDTVAAEPVAGGGLFRS